MLFTTKGKFMIAAVAAGVMATSAQAQTRTETHQGTGRSDAEAIANAKRGAQNMVNRINAQTIQAYHTITGYGSESCEPPSVGQVRTCYVDVTIRQSQK